MLRMAVDFSSYVASSNRYRDNIADRRCARREGFEGAVKRARPLIGYRGNSVIKPYSEREKGTERMSILSTAKSGGLIEISCFREQRAMADLPPPAPLPTMIPFRYLSLLISR